jgi:hypothetical protein
MQASACLTASLIYAWLGVHAWRVLPGSMRLKCAAILIFPAIYLVAAIILPLAIAPLRRLLKRYVWMSFNAGFGQTPISVLVSLGVLAHPGQKRLVAGRGLGGWGQPALSLIESPNSGR